MMASNNILSPGLRRPHHRAVSQDVVLGLYYMTLEEAVPLGVTASFDDAALRVKAWTFSTRSSSSTASREASCPSAQSVENAGKVLASDPLIERAPAYAEIGVIERALDAFAIHLHSRKSAAATRPCSRTSDRTSRR